MADDRVRLHQVKSCNVGKLGSDGVALKINFAMNDSTGKVGPDLSAVFGLSHELAHGLAEALTSIVNDTAAPASIGPAQN